ncbi:MAG TPA: hypothetical protein VGM03_01760 [Phycisphaerae bacterium]|jgi:hypothetical protein
MQTEIVQNGNLAAAPGDKSLKALRAHVDKVVGSVFYGNLLKTMRPDPLKGKFGHGGRGEEVFSAQLDQVLAERAGQARHYSLNEALFEHLAKQQARMSPQNPAREGGETYMDSTSLAMPTSPPTGVRGSDARMVLRE